MDDINLILKQQEEADKKNKMMAGLGALGDTASSSQSFGNFFLGRMNPQATGGRELAKSQASDPMERQRKAMEYMKAKREMAQMGAADDPNHADAATYRQQLEVLAPSLKGKLEGMTLAQMERTSPILMAKIRGDQERENARIAAGQRAEEKALARQDRLDARADKQKELSSAQAKQRGLYEIGQRAENQFSKATGDDSGHDPTSVLEFIDNSKWAPNILKSDKAVESQAAQNAWIESFLRDASGAAIPDSEREAYGRIYFPRPGDTDDVVKNKAALRAQKMDSARIAAGVETGHGPAVSPQVQVAGDDKVEVYAPDGTLKRIKKADLPRAIAAGGRLKDGPAVGAK